MAATNERSNETNRYTDKGATASVSLCLSLLYVAVLMPEGGRERRISCTHPSPNYMHATSVARLSSLEHGADAAKGTHTPPRRNIFSSSPPRPSRLSRSLPIHGCPESGLTRVRPSEGSRGSGPDQAGFVRSFSGIRANLSLHQMPQFSFEVRVALTGPPQLPPNPARYATVS